MNLVEYNGLHFSSGTPVIIMDVVSSCVENETPVHILTGDPVTGIITPTLHSAGVLFKSSGEKPTPMFKSRVWLTPSGEREKKGTYRTSWVNTERILKIVNSETGELLYQSYECRAPAALEFIEKTIYSPYDEPRSVVLVHSSSPEYELQVPSGTNSEQLCRFLLGCVHSLEGCFGSE